MEKALSKVLGVEQSHPRGKTVVRIEKVMPKGKNMIVYLVQSKSGVIFYAGTDYEAALDEFNTAMLHGGTILPIFDKYVNGKWAERIYNDGIKLPASKGVYTSMPTLGLI